MTETDHAKIGMGSMAFGTLLLSMPVALFSALWLHLLKGWPVLDALAAYSILGAATVLVIALSTALGRMGKA